MKLRGYQSGKPYTLYKSGGLFARRPLRHNGAPFLKLNEVKAGDSIRVKMPYATFVYRVRETFIVT